LPGTYSAYIKSIQARSGKSPDDFWELANQKGFIKQAKIIARHAELLTWLKSEIGLGHVHANMVITYLRLRAKDPRLTEGMRNWAYSTGYKDGQ
jgi:hypothetical protein